VTALIAIGVVVSSILFLCGTYIIWPSRWNIPAHLNLGLGLVGYVIPVFFAGVLETFPQDIVRFYAKVLVVGAIFYLLGLLVGGRIPVRRLLRLRFSFSSLPYQVFKTRVARRSTVILILGLAGLLLSFYVMGFIPMFAADPMAAKFFRGEYEASFRRVSYLYRFSDEAVVALLPVALVLWYVTRRAKFLVLSLMAVIVISLTLQRGHMGFGIMLFLGLVAARRRNWFWIYVVVVLLVFPFGAAIYHFAGNLFGVDKFMLVEADTPWDLITRGAPDVPDQLNLMAAFLDYGHFTYGRTFIGGAFPGSGNYLWNPAVWALTLLYGGVNRANVSEIVSGGLRLPVAMWGYTAFGWTGIVTVSFLSGLIGGWTTAFVKRFVGEKSMLTSMMALAVYGSVGSQLAQFYVMSINSLPAILVYLILARRGQAVASSASTENAGKPILPENHQPLRGRAEGQGSAVNPPLPYVSHRFVPDRGRSG